MISFHSRTHSTTNIVVVVVLYTQTTNPSKYEIFHRCSFSLPRIGIGCQRMDAWETNIDREFNLITVVIVDYDVVN